MAASVSACCARQAARQAVPVMIKPGFGKELGKEIDAAVFIKGKEQH